MPGVGAREPHSLVGQSIQVWRAVILPAVEVQVGDAQVSDKHGNFIVNQGDATARDVLTLIRKVRAAVARKTGTKLELELKLVGEG